MENNRARYGNFSRPARGRGGGRGGPRGNEPPRDPTVAPIDAPMRPHGVYCPLSEEGLVLLLQCLLCYGILSYSTILHIVQGGAWRFTCDRVLRLFPRWGQTPTGTSSGTTQGSSNTPASPGTGQPRIRGAGNASLKYLRAWASSLPTPGVSVSTILSDLQAILVPFQTVQSFVELYSFHDAIKAYNAYWAGRISECLTASPEKAKRSIIEEILKETFKVPAAEFKTCCSWFPRIVDSRLKASKKNKAVQPGNGGDGGGEGGRRGATSSDSSSSNGNAKGADGSSTSSCSSSSSVDPGIQVAVPVPVQSAPESTNIPVASPGVGIAANMANRGRILGNSPRLLPVPLPGSSPATPVSVSPPSTPTHGYNLRGNRENKREDAPGSPGNPSQDGIPSGMTPLPQAVLSLMATIKPS
eukprot:GHVQ01019599.1.p1 GENE.GHVQ01019599.1~~GHVQ01019599.1.p1  ORF type:complete len:414 (+),score=31.25 GHVQ01019599.1:85-1326(+)